MTGIFTILEDFSDPPLIDGTSPETDNADDVAAAEQGLEMFDRGYQAGWDDAVAAQVETHANLSEELAKSVADIALPYHDALAQMQENFRPAINILLGELLPRTLADAFGARLAADLADFGHRACAGPVIVVVPNGQADTISQVLAVETDVPIEVQEADDCPKGALRLTVGDTLYQIDTAATVAAVETAISEYFELIKGENSNVTIS